MKLSLSRLKNTDWKQFGVNHGEKIALAGVGLLVLLILLMGTRWKTYDEKEPTDLTKGVEEQAKILEAATWPEEEQKKYTDAYDVNEVYENTYSVVKAEPFRYPPSHSMIFALHRRQEPIEEPNWLPVEELIATPDSFILQLPPEGQEPIQDGALALGDEPGEPGTGTSREDALLGKFKIKSPQNGAGEGGGPGFEGGGPMGGGEFPGGAPGMDPGMAPGMDPMGMEFAGGEGMEMGMGMGMDETGAEINARGVRYVAVRGVYPFRKQFEAITNARHDPTLSNFRQYVDIMDFEIQRQTAKPGPNPWSDKDADWETLDQSVARDLLAEAANYAEYVVDYSQIHYVITSPLPARLVGIWHPYFIGHSKIKTYSQKQLELRRLLNEELVRLEKEYKKQNADLPGGFAGAQRDMTSLQMEVTGDSSQKRQLFNNLKNVMNPTGEEGFVMPQSDLDGMLASASQIPDYVLFRYLDFDVEPGKAYRYRVKLKLRNPNYGELADNLAAENVGTGKYRFTPWSVPTTPSIVPDDSKYFVVEADPGSSRNEPTAKVDLYQWLSEIGTTANKVVSVHVGQIIGQPKPDVDEDKPMDVDEKLLVEVLRPFQSFKGEPMELATHDAVVDLEAPPKERASDFHQDLGIRELKRLVVSQVLVVNEFGELENRNPLAQLKARATAKKFLDAEYEPWEYLKHLGEQNMEGMGEDGMFEGMGDGMGDIGGLLESGGRGGRSKGGKGGRSSGGRGMGAPPGSGRANPLRRNQFGGGAGGP